MTGKAVSVPVDPAELWQLLDAAHRLAVFVNGTDAPDAVRHLAVDLASDIAGHVKEYEDRMRRMGQPLAYEGSIYEVEDYEDLLGGG